MNILITGSNGFLGGSTYRYLSNKYKVFALDHNFSYYGQYLVRDRTKPSTIIHFGWGGAKNSNDLNNLKQIDNIPNTIELFKFGMYIGIQKFIFVGSSWQYSRYGSNLYSFSKNKTHEILQKLCETNDIKYNLIIPFWIYGPNDHKNRFIPKIINLCINNQEICLHPSENLIDYLFIKDFVSAIEMVLNNGKNLESYDICSSSRYKIKDITEGIKSLTNSQSRIIYNKEYPPNFNMEWVGNNYKLTDLGWLPMVRIEEGLKETVEHYRNNG